MENRKQKLLSHIIEAHIKTASPVGSSLIVSKYMKDVSSPTVRNEMRDLEKEGLITQPHTSAGRVPTELGYRRYIENLSERPISEKLKCVIDDASRDFDDNFLRIKNLAKSVSEISEEAVLVAFSENDIYYTGLSNLFSKPEFSTQNMVIGISEAIDGLDSVVSGLSKSLDQDITVLLGSDNPFGDNCGSILAKFSGGTVFGILGPMRMDYDKNICLMKYIKNKMN